MAAEVAAMLSVVESYATVTNVTFIWKGEALATDTDITFRILTSPSHYRGFAEAPGDRSVYGMPHSDILIWRNNYVDPQSGLQPGSFDFATYLHEFGHALGLAHPHDAGGTSTSFPGTDVPSDLGEFDLNQGIFTVMSYNNGWATRSVQPSDSTFGLQATPMALDVMALQHIYGVKSFATGNDTYLLNTKSYVCIYDTGGNDTIRYSGTNSAFIDLRAATGEIAAGEGGRPSFIQDRPGGYTIARGCIIENAVGGSGNDVIRGNASDNRLTGGLGRDILSGGEGRDCFVFTRTADSARTPDIISGFQVQLDRIDLRLIDADISRAGNQAFSLLRQALFTDEAQLRLSFKDGSTYVQLNTDADTAAECVIRLTGIHRLTAYDFIL